MSVGRAGRAFFESLYARFNRRELVHPDPLEFLYEYEDVRDREIAGLVASSLAYGRVAQILRSVGDALSRLGNSPARTLERSSACELRRAFAGFRHRFTTGLELASVLYGARELVRKHGSLGAFVARSLDRRGGNVLGAISALVREIDRRSGRRHSGLLPLPGEGSACKRLNLYFRWMVRRDDVDPGGWEGVPRAALVVPLDTHMHRLAIALGLTERRTADMAAALEVTAAFRSFAPEDPVRYDFALTRLGIRPDPDCRALLRELGRDRRACRDGTEAA